MPESRFQPPKHSRRIVHLQRRAKQDLQEIWGYSFRTWGVRQADLYYDALVDGIEGLIDQPEMGMNRDDLRRGCRQLQVHRHLVFYRLTPTRIRVIRILGVQMDVDRHL